MRGHRAGVLWMPLIAVWLLGTDPAHAQGRVKGVVIDSETKRPIGGALVRVQMLAWCADPGTHVSSQLQPVRERVTGADGRFWAGDEEGWTSCRFRRWKYSLEILAPGYLSETMWNAATPPQVFELDRIRYQLDLDTRRARVSKERLMEPGPDPRVAAALAALERQSGKPEGRPGVFVSQAGAGFDRVATVERSSLLGQRRWLVIAQDGKTGALHGWTAGGIAEPVPALPAGARLITQRHPRFDTRPFLERAGVLHLHAKAGELQGAAPPLWSSKGVPTGDIHSVVPWEGWIVTTSPNRRELVAYSAGRWLGQPAFDPKGLPSAAWPGSRVDVVERLLGVDGSIECMTALNKSAPIVLFVVAAGRRDVYVLTSHPSDTELWRAERMDRVSGSVTGEVTACAGGEQAVYAAVKDRGIVKVDVGSVSTPTAPKRGVKVSAPVAVAGPSGPVNVRALAVGDLPVGIGDPPSLGLYAVAGDGVVYRFSADLRPDQRIE